MITKYFTKVSVRFDPFSPSAKAVRLFLARIPPQQKSGCAIEFKILNNPSDKPEVKVTYKDKNVIEINPEEKTFADLSSFFDTHSRKLAIKDAINT